MGKNWGRGGAPNWRRVRQSVLDRDRYECQARLPGCTFTATEVHHGVALAAARRGEIDDEAEACIAICPPCHNKITERQKIAGQRAANQLRKARRRLPVPPHPGER